MTSISGRDDGEAIEVAEQFGVALEQVRRDHLISLVLAALSPHSDDLVFFGGTALARTYLPWADSAKTSISSPSQIARS